MSKSLASKPFRPFRLHMSDGESYQVNGSDTMFVMTGRVILGSDPDEAGIP